MRPNLHGCRVVEAPWVGSVSCAMAIVLGARSFLPSQVIWLDEATQLSGLRLDPIRVVRWLAGTESHDFGQFRDRMPPVSYWLGWAWGRAFGADEASMRWFGVACVAMATAMVFLTARRAFGGWAGWASGLLFASSPGIVMIAVEIRAYPLFLLTSAASFYALMRLVEAPEDPADSGRWAWLAILSLTLSMAVGTHFFGVVLAGACLGTIAAHSWRTRRIGGLLAVSVLVGLAVLAVVPFVRAAVGITRVPSRIGAMARLESVYRLLLELSDHPSLMIDRRVEACFFIGLSILIVAAIRSGSAATRAVALTMGAGLGAVAAIQLAFGRGSFNACSANYNLWMKPGFCLIAAAGVGSRSRAVRRLAGAAAGLVIATQAIGVVQLACRGDHLAHGPHRAISTMIRELGTTDLAVLHDDGSGQFVFVACPIRHEFGPDLEQFRLVDPNDGSRVIPLIGDPAPRSVEALPHRYLLVVRCAPTGDQKLVRQIRSGDRPIDSGPILIQGRASIGRRLIRRDLQVARISARIDVFELTRRRQEP
jgi:hypothetical protein